METSQEILTELIKTLKANFAAELERLPMKKGTRETLCSGFADGVRIGVYEAVKLLGVTVKR